MPSFAIDYSSSPFLETSYTGSNVNRLNWRAEVLLTRNRDAIAGKRILDLASHDGRFSYACLQLGAAHVTGVEGRSHLVDSANRNLEACGLAQEQFRFVHGDALTELRKSEPRSFDVILCFGFFYHITSQVDLLLEVRRLRPQSFILDTTVDMKLSSNVAYLKFHVEKPELDPNTVDSTGLAAKPSQALVELLFTVYGFEFRELAWPSDEIEDWSSIEGYRTKERVSYLATPPSDQQR